MDNVSPEEAMCYFSILIFCSALTGDDDSLREICSTVCTMCSQHVFKLQQALKIIFTGNICETGPLGQDERLCVLIKN